MEWRHKYAGIGAITVGFTKVTKVVYNHRSGWASRTCWRTPSCCRGSWAAPSRPCTSTPSGCSAAGSRSAPPAAGCGSASEPAENIRWKSKIFHTSTLEICLCFDYILGLATTFHNLRGLKTDEEMVYWKPVYNNFITEYVAIFIHQASEDRSDPKNQDWGDCCVKWNIKCHIIG